MEMTFENSLSKDWFYTKDDLIELFPNGVATTGSGPFGEDLFDKFLSCWGIKVCGDLEADDLDLNTLVIGREKWDEFALDVFIDNRRGEDLYVYSQEMFLSRLVSRKDPYDNSKKILESLGRGHPALEHLRASGFEWPETTIVPTQGRGSGRGSGSRSKLGDWPKVGLLSYMGYNVGEEGGSRWERRNILTKVFTSRVPQVQSNKYMEQWGDPLSSKRLQKLANSIASYARNAKKKGSSYEEAVADWEDDLSWLKEEFYRGRFTFLWP